MFFKQTRLIIFLISLAVLGLISIQFYWMKHAIKVQEELFDENIIAVLENVTDQLEKNEYLEFISSQRFTNMPDSMLFKDHLHRNKRGLFLENKMFLEKKIEAYSFSTETTKDSIDVVVEILKNGEHRREKRKIKFDDQATLLRKLLIELDTRKSVSKRMNKVTIDSIITKSLIDKHIDTPYKSRIINEKIKQRIPKHQSEYKIRLFPRDPFYNDHFLLLSFPEKEAFILNEILWMLILSLVLIFVLISCFWYSIKTIFKQKKLSDLKNDFINNMTHELKTPISTISLACEGILKGNTVENAQKISRYTHVIKDENKRLEEQVTKILQMAVLDKSTFTFEYVNVHRMINEVKESFGIRLAECNGQIRMNYQSIFHELEIDRIHFKNVLVNLLDNAIKYCERTPFIQISVTDLSEGFICISVADNGIGLSHEEQKMVFEKFYRVPTGDRHDVKGFGLGLSYVKVIMDAHFGSVDVESKQGLGTTFKLVLPIHHKKGKGSL